MKACMRARWSARVGLACLVAAAVACSMETRVSSLSKALSQAADLHRQAEAKVAGGDIEGAVRCLRQAATAVPEGSEEGPDVRTDAYAEISRLWTAQGEGARAEEAARTAIGYTREASFFQGLAWLRLGDALKLQGRGREAVAAFERSIAINTLTQERILLRRRAR